MADDKQAVVSGSSAIGTIKKQLEAGLLFKQPRMDKLKLIEEMYAMKERPALVGRFSVPFDGVILRGYIDTLISKIDNTTELKFIKTKGSALKAALKMTAAWQKESTPERANWPLKDRWGKKQMSLTGRAFYKAYGEAGPFRFNIDNVDHYDIVPEPNGGGHLSSHLFTYQMNIFRTKDELIKGADTGRYIKTEVNKLINGTNSSEFKENEDAYRNKVSRFASHGLDAESNNYVGSQLFNLTEGITVYDSQMYYALFDYKSGIVVRFEPLKKVFESGLTPWVSYSSDDDAFNFWNLGPADVIYPVADAEYLNLNGMLNNMRKRNDDMVAYDKQAVTDPSQLAYRPDGLISLALGGKDIRSVLMNMRPDDVSNLAINLHGFLNNFLGENSGITAGAKGVANEDKVGIYFGNIQQVADRIGRYNKSYSSGIEEIGRRFDWALWENAGEDYMVQILGEKGAEWSAITKEDKDPDFEVAAVGGNAEMAISQAKSEKQRSTFELIANNQILVSKVNPTVLVRELLQGAEVEESRIEAITNVVDESNELIISEAERLIEDCLQGRPLQIYRGADVAFVQHIQNYATNTRLDQKDFYKLMLIVEQHMPIVAQNMTRKAMLLRSAISAKAGGSPLAPGGPAPEEAPAPEAEQPVK